LIQENDLGVHVGEIVSQTEIVRQIFLMEIRVPDLAGKCRPGHFVHVKAEEGWDPLWRRPFSIHRVLEGGRNVQLLYRRIGKGTAIMQSLESGDRISLLGPLGNPFHLEGSFETAVIAAGGLGVAPAFFLIDELIKSGKRNLLFWGVRRSEEFFRLDELKRQGVEILLATEDGSAGFHGRVTDLVEDYFSGPPTLKDPRGFGCGPMPMLHTLQNTVRRTGFDWQASLEERMACGSGVCQGCAVRVRSGGFRMVCSDGPVFDLMELDFHG
jgi:dihydroorotate dehydrogenase electron transfer subunit